MPPQLVALTEGPDILLDKPILLVGRHQECDIQISSRKISRKHCLIAQVNDHLVVRDLFSTNGIHINGAKVEEGSLHTGDELTIGNFRYRVNMDPEAGEEVATQPRASGSPPLGKPVQSAGKNTFDSCEEPIALSESVGKDLADSIENPVLNSPDQSLPDKNALP